MHKMKDYQTAAAVIEGATSLEAKRAASIAHLRSIGRYIVDPGCTWRPRPACQTDVRKTWAEARKREGLK
jgi:hypothetical protein